VLYADRRSTVKYRDGSDEMRAGDAHEDVQFAIGDGILAIIMQLMTGERSMEV